MSLISGDAGQVAPAAMCRGWAARACYVDMASGIHAYRNIAYNNAHDGIVFAGDWRDGDMIFHNNIAANGLYGFRLIGPEFDTHGGSVNTQIGNNIVVNNESYGILLYDNDGVHRQPVHRPQPLL